MKPALLTRNVFLDTSIFSQEAFDFRSSRFDTLHGEAWGGTVRLYSTDITRREVLKRIRADVTEAFREIRKAGSKLRVLRNLEGDVFAQIRARDGIDKLCAKIEEEYVRFLHYSKAEEVKTEQVSIPAVFERYFNEQPPFGEGSKKSEFPDAFVLEALSAWCVKNQEHVYVISGDPDMRKYCDKSDRLYYLPSLNHVLDLISAQQEVLSESLKRAIVVKADYVAEQVEAAFKDLAFYVESDTVLADVDEVRVLDVDTGSPLIIDLRPESAEVSVDVTIRFAVTLSLSDSILNNADEEWKVPSDMSVEQQGTYSVGMSVSYPRELPEQLKISDVLVNMGQDVEVRVQT